MVRGCETKKYVFFLKDGTILMIDVCKMKM